MSKKPNRRWFVWLAMWVPLTIVMFPVGVVMAQGNVIDAARVRAVCEKVAATYQLQSAKGQPLELAGPSRLEWSKNTSEDVYGNVFVWTDQGVPSAVASIFQFVRPKDDLDCEFQSLSETPIRASVGGTTVWRPSSPGVTFRPLVGGPPVAPRDRLRRTQIGLIARQFKAQRTDNVTRLRLLPRPIVEYSNEDRGILTGAMFAFVDATDPEVWLIIEARVADGGDAAWHYAIARMNTRSLMVQHGDQEVFRAEALERWDEPDAPYAIFQRLQDEAAFSEVVRGQ